MTRRSRFVRVSTSLWASVAALIFWIAGAPAGAQIWDPDPGSSFQIQFKDPVDTSIDADVFDVDLFDTDEQTVAELEARVTLMTCYLSAGTWEDWRPDAGSYPPQVLGNAVDGWPGERWVDIRRIDLLGPILTARLDLCRDKGFDAVDPDNIDGYQNTTGFPLTKTDQIRFNRWLAQEAHKRNLSIALKNAPLLVPDLVNDFDWALTESCFNYGWCSMLNPFLSAGKAVFDIEYSDTDVDFANACANAPSGMTVILKDRDLDAHLITCP
ncbi:MAG: endo alpha-1,4 polygalactosaminidase [Acidobacteria bacterium]|nr:MAG: endo alpha-1,4 polygalactosaminidase [Acidobacteriota bacterium]